MRLFRRMLQRLTLRGLLWVAAVPILVAGLGRFEVTFHMEAMTLTPSQETWRRQVAGEADAWLNPSLYGVPRVNKPPLTVWMNMLAWTGFDRATPTDALVLRARLVAVSLAVLTILATGWAGLARGNRRTALLAMAVLATMLLFVRKGRLATYDTYLLAWCTVAVAAGWHALWRARSDRTRWACWTLAGIAAGLGVLSKGPITYLFTAAPWVLGVLATRERRPGAWPGVAAALGVSVAVAAPWFLHVLQEVAGAGDHLATEFRARRKRPAPPWYYLGLIGLVFPWSLALVAGITASLRTRLRDLPRFRFDPVVAWFLWIFVVMSLPEAKQQRYILPILPAAALVIARWWRYGHAGRRWTGWDRAHRIVLFAGAAVFAVFPLVQDPLVRAGVLRSPEIVGVPLFVLWTASGVMALLAACVSRWLHEGHRTAAAAATALWFAAAGIPGFHGYAQTPRHQYAMRADAERIAQVAGAMEIGYYSPPYREWWQSQPDAQFQLYSRLIIRPVSPDTLTGTDAPPWLLAEDLPAITADLAAAGYRESGITFRDHRGARRLWQRPPP